jgi:hypothetical protein
MNSERPQPPALAVFLLRHLCPKDRQEALTGDLFERFGEGQSDGWFWRQVLIAMLVGVSSGLRLHWPQIAFAIVGTPLLWFESKIMRMATIEGLWSWGISLHWPLSTVYDLGFQAALAALLVQPLLAVLLLLDRKFSWLSQLRTLAVSFPLFAAAVLIRYGLGPPQRASRFSLMQLVPFFALLISAWVGWPSRPRLQRHR